MGAFVPSVHAIQNSILLVNHPDWGRSNRIEIGIGHD